MEILMVYVLLLLGIMATYSTALTFKPRRQKDKIKKEVCVKKKVI